MSGGPTGKMPVLHTSEPRDLTPGDHDVPPFHLGGQDMYAISPDGQEVAYTSNIESEAGPAFVEATSTNNDIFIVPMTGGNRQSGLDPKKISTSPGSDSTPLYSPDGKYIAWRSQARAGFEADRWRLLLHDRQSGQTRELTEKFDRSVGSFTWSPDAPRIFFTAEDHGTSRVFSVSFAGEVVPDLNGRFVRPNPAEHVIHADDVVYVNDTLFFGGSSAAAPTEVMAGDEVASK